MKYKIDNKYIVEAESFQDAIKAVKCLKNEKVNDAQQVYTIHWIDTYARSKGYDRSLCRHTTEIKANDVAEALKKLSGKVVLDFGVGTANCLVVSVSTPKTTYQWSGHLSELVKNSKEDLGDSVNDTSTCDSINDGMKEYVFIWIDLVKQQKYNYDREHEKEYLHRTVIKAENDFEALKRLNEKLDDYNVYSSSYCFIRIVSGAHSRLLQIGGNLHTLLQKSKSSFEDAVKDADKDFIIVQLVMGNRYKVAEWPAVSADAALEEFMEANPRWSGRKLQAIPKNEWKGTYADAEDTYWKVRYGHEDDEIQYTSVLIVKGSSEQDVIRKFKSRKPGYKIFSVTEGVPEGVESMRRRGMSVWDD